MPYTIIDRTLNGKKSSGNRSKFIRRVKKTVTNKVKEQINKQIADGSVDDLVAGKGKKVNIPKKNLRQPTFEQGKGGKKSIVLPGNKQYNQGDRLPRPPEGGGKGKGASKDGEGEDTFTFELTFDEFLDIFFEDCELPDLRNNVITQTEEFQYKRAGFSVDGPQSRLNIERTMRTSKGRRIGLMRKGKKNRLAELELEEARIVIDLAEAEDEKKEQRITYLQDRLNDVKREINVLRRKLRAVPFIDNHDLRYTRYEKLPVPTSQAVMFCVDGDTEYLTKTGWKKISDYQNEEIAQYNQDGSISFVKPTYVKNDYDGEFLEIKGQGINQLLTPEHRVIYKTKTGNIKEIQASEFKKRHNNARYGARAKFITHFTYDGKGLNLSDDEIKLHIAFKADGTYQQENTNRAQFIFAKKRKVKRLTEILKNLNIEYNISYSENSTTRIYFTTKDRISKTYGEEWYQATTSQKKIIGEEVLLWDGYKGTQNTFMSGQKEDTDYIQFVWASLGFGTNVYFSSSVWVVYRSNYSERSLTSKTPKKITSKQLQDKHSYCFSVPSTMLVLRRNNNIFVTGNCLMDVSGSMGEWEKEMAKRYFMLLYLFLTRSYERVEVVWIRHHSTAKVVDEDEFFRGRETGGTIVSSALEKMVEVKKEKYPPDLWNIYGSQVSDGDNWGEDSHLAKDLLVREILPFCRYYTYIEVTKSDRITDLWPIYESITTTHPNFQMKKVSDVSDIYPVFQQLFKKNRRVKSNDSA